MATTMNNKPECRARVFGMLVLMSATSACLDAGAEPSLELGDKEGQPMQATVPRDDSKR